MFGAAVGACLLVVEGVDDGAVIVGDACELIGFQVARHHEGAGEEVARKGGFAAGAVADEAAYVGRGVALHDARYVTVGDAQVLGLANYAAYLGRRGVGVLVHNLSAEPAAQQLAVLR